MRSDNQLLWWSHCFGAGEEEDKNVLDIFSFVHITVHVFFKYCEDVYLFAWLSPWLRDPKVDKNGIWDLVDLSDESSRYNGWSKTRDQV